MMMQFLILSCTFRSISSVSDFKMQFSNVFSTLRLFNFILFCFCWFSKLNAWIVFCSCDVWLITRGVRQHKMQCSQNKLEMLLSISCVLCGTNETKPKMQSSSIRNATSICRFQLCTRYTHANHTLSSVFLWWQTRVYFYTEEWSIEMFISLQISIATSHCY